LNASSPLSLIIALSALAIVGGILIIHLTVGLKFDVLPLRIFWPSKVRAYPKQRVERVEAGCFFTVASVCGHVLELRGFDLCIRLDKMGKYIQCPECLHWEKIISIIEGRLMNAQERELQMKEFQAWIEAMERLEDFPFSV
jgi:hypothetical protein